VGYEGGGACLVQGKNAGGGGGTQVEDGSTRKSYHTRGKAGWFLIDLNQSTEARPSQTKTQSSAHPVQEKRHVSRFQQKKKKGQQKKESSRDQTQPQPPPNPPRGQVGRPPKTKYRPKVTVSSTQDPLQGWRTSERGPDCRVQEKERVTAMRKSLQRRFHRGLGKEKMSRSRARSREGSSYKHPENIMVANSPRKCQQTGKQ